MDIKEDWIKQAKVSKEKYAEMYKESIENNDSFWNQHGNRIDWIKKYSKIKKIKYSNKEVDINWFYDGSLNVSYNCIDRHANENHDRVAIIWEGDNPNESKKNYL